MDAPTWAIFKTFVTTYSIPIQWIDLGTLYFLKAYQGPFDVDYYMPKDGGSDQTDFETNYKTNGNIPVPPPVSPYSTNAYGTKNLYVTITGIQETLIAGTNTITYTVPYIEALISGVTVVNCEVLDIVSFSVLDSTTGTYSGTANAVLNQFGYNVNLPADQYEYQAPYTAVLHENMQIQLTYTSVSAKTIGVNFILNQVR